MTTNNPMPCPKCGQPHTKCSGHKRDGTPCGQRAMKGQRVCKMHGGSAPQAREAAGRRLAQQQAAAMMRTLGEPVEMDPVQALHMLISTSAGHVQWYRGQLANYLPDALVWGDTEVKQSDMHGLTVTQRAEVNIWLRLYNDERAFLANVCARAIHAGLAEREVRLAEQRGAMISEVIRRVLADLEMPPEAQQQAQRLVPVHLRAVGTRPQAA